MKQIKCVAISDTHTLEDGLVIPKCDILIHAGDYTNIGERPDVIKFLSWLTDQPAKYKVFCAGNHERSHDPKFSIDNRVPAWLKEVFDYFRVNDGTSGIYYLEDSSITLDGINIHGSPWTPDFYPQHWAFNKARGQIKVEWEKIPMDTDILITHGPPAYILDYVPHKQLYAGCEDLRFYVEMIKPKFHVFGHIHPGYGLEEKPDTTFINAAICNNSYHPVNKPIEFTIDV